MKVPGTIDITTVFTVAFYERRRMYITPQEVRRRYMDGRG